MQPLHVDDAVRAIVQLLGADTVLACLDLVGPDSLTTDGLTAALRRWLGLPKRRWAKLPLPALRAAALVGDWLPGAMLTQESLAMLQAGNTAESGSMQAALGWRARPVDAALARCRPRRRGSPEPCRSARSRRAAPGSAPRPAVGTPGNAQMGHSAPCAG